MYRFNHTLFRMLPKVLGKMQMEISESLFGNGYTYARRIKSPDSILFTELVRLCNTFRISLSSFVSIEPEDTLFSDSTKYVIPSDKFLPVEFHPKHLKRLYGSQSDSLCRIDRKQLASDLGVSVNTISNWINADVCSISVDMLLRICNTYTLNLSHFVDDRNTELDRIEGTAPGEPVSRRVWMELKELRAASRQLGDKCVLLEQENQRLRSSVRTDYYLSELSDTTYRSHSRTSWSFHYGLLESLPTILGVTKKEFTERAGISAPDFIQRSERMPVEWVIRLANVWHVSTRHFFLRCSSCPPVTADRSFYVSAQWHPVRFHPERFNDLFVRNGLTGYSLKEIVELMDIDKSTTYKWRSNPLGMTVPDLLSLCNRLDITPSCFIDDRNRSEIPYRVTHTEYLMEENLLLRQKILRLEEKLRRKGIPSTSDE